MPGLFPGLQLFQPQEQTLDYTQQEPFWSYLKRKLNETVPFMKQDLLIYPQDIDRIKNIGSMIYDQKPINVDQYFNPIQGQNAAADLIDRTPQPGLFSGAGLSSYQGQDASSKLGIQPKYFTGPNFMQPQSYGARLFTDPKSFWNMKTSPNVIPGGGPDVGPQMPMQLTTPPPPVQNQGVQMPPQAPQQPPQPQQAQMPFMLPGRQEQMSFEDYYKKMMSMQPQREKNWMDSPLYPLSMALMGIGQNLMTPSYHRGYVNPMAPMMGALQQQAQLQAQNDPRMLFEKAVASYPHFIQATRTGTPKFRYVMDAQGNIKGVLPEGGATVLPQEQQPQETLIWTGDKYVRGVPGAKYIGRPTEDVERGYNVYDEATGANTWIPSQGKGPVLKRSRDIFQSMNQQSQGTVPVKNNRTGQIEMMPKEEARRRGLIP